MRLQHFEEIHGRQREEGNDSNIEDLVSGGGCEFAYLGSESDIDGFLSRENKVLVVEVGPLLIGQSDVGTEYSFSSLVIQNNAIGKGLQCPDFRRLWAGHSSVNHKRGGGA